MSTRHAVRGQSLHDSARSLFSLFVESQERPLRRRGISSRGPVTLLSCLCPNVFRGLGSGREYVRLQRPHKRHFGSTPWLSQDGDHPRRSNAIVENLDDEKHLDLVEQVAASPIMLEDLINANGPRTKEDKNLLWRAWMGMSEDTQATRLQLLESLLEMLHTEDPQDARRLRSLLDSKHGLIDARQRPFYSFWAHMILQETDIAYKHYVVLAQSAQFEHLRFFMQKIVETGDWSTGVKLWHLSARIQDNPRFWYGENSIRQLLNLIPNLHTFQFLSVLAPEEGEVFKPFIRPAVVIHISAQGNGALAVPMIEDALSKGQVVRSTEVSAVVRSIAQVGETQKAIDLYHNVLGSSSCPPQTHVMSIAALYAATNSSKIDILRSLLDNGIMDRLRAPGGSIAMLLPYTAAMSVFAKFGDTFRVEALFQEYLGQGLKPDAHMLGTLIHARVTTLELDEARRLFQICESEYNIKPDQAMYNMLLHSHADVSDVSSGLQILNLLVEVGFLPDAYTAATLIDLYAHRKDGVGAKRMFDRMMDLGVTPNLTVFGSLMHAYVEAEEFESMRDVLQELDARNLKPNQHIMNILLKGLQKTGRSFEEMTELISGMEPLGILPNDVTRTVLLRALVQENNLDAAIALFKSIPAPTQFHYTVVMFGLLREHSRRGFQPIMHYYHEMMQRGLPPTYITLAVLINACVINDTPQAARQVNDLLDAYTASAHLDLTSKYAPRTSLPPSIFQPVLHAKSGTIGILNSNKIFRSFLTSVVNPDGSLDVRTMTAIMNTYAATDSHAKVVTMYRAIKQAIDRLYRYDPSIPPQAPGSNRLQEQNSTKPIETLPAGEAAPIQSENELEYQNRTFTVTADSSESNDGDRKPDPSVHSEPEQSEPAQSATSPPKKKYNQVSHGARYAMCIPFSIWTKVMFRAARFGEIERNWATLHAQGYVFDDFNWNQFIRVTITQGKVEEGLEMIVARFGGDGGRMHRRTKQLCLRAFEALRETDSITTRHGEEKGSDVMKRIYENYASVILLLES